MANIFGTTPPTIYYNNQTFQLPLSDRGGREEDFVKVIKNWESLDNVIKDRVKGFRLSCSYKWAELEGSEIDNLIIINNFIGDLKLQLSTLPTRYPVRVAEWKHGMADGLNSDSAAEITFEGTTLVKSYPSPDLVYFMPPLYDSGAMVITLQEQVS